MNVEFTARAARDYAGLPARIQRAVDKQLDFLCEDIRHPSIRAKKYAEAGIELWQGRVNRDYRFYFQIEGGTYQIVRIIPHPK